MPRGRLLGGRGANDHLADRHQLLAQGLEAGGVDAVVVGQEDAHAGMLAMTLLLSGPRRYLGPQASKSQITTPSFPAAANVRPSGANVTVWTTPIPQSQTAASRSSGRAYRRTCPFQPLARSRPPSGDTTMLRTSPMLACTRIRPRALATGQAFRKLRSPA